MTASARLSVEDWNRLNRLLEAGLALDAANRSGWLETLPPESAHLHPLLEKLLAESQVTGFADDRTPPTSVVRMASDAITAMRTEQPGDRIGPWRLERLLGEGGMGSVWLAQRADGVMQRTAALKLPRAEWVDRGLTERIARERAILARLQHPNIAVLYDAGLGADGRPFLALEYVDGTPMDAYCRSVDLRQVLRLFILVARAVAYAHSRLVIHRDLKFSNVLIAEDGTPKLLDFGISKLIEGDSAGDATALTRFAGRPLTLAYAAPEQVLGQPVAVGSDVYSLGVMLFELLSGARLYTATTSHALEAEILRGDLRRASDGAIEKARAKQLRGDLDAIVQTALKRAPEQRYQSAAELADDLERYLDNKPVRAQADSTVYRLRKFVSRNQAGVVAGAAVVLALTIGLGVALWQAQQAQVQADEARMQAQRATDLNTFVLSLIRQSDPRASQASRAGDLALLSSIEQRIDAEFKGSAEQLVQLRVTVADAYRERGQHAAARRVYRRAISEGEATLPADHLGLLKAHAGLTHPTVADEAALQSMDSTIERLRRAGPAAAEPLIDALLGRNERVRLIGRWTGMTPESVLADAREAHDLAVRHFGAGSMRHVETAHNMVPALLGGVVGDRPRERQVAEAFAVLESALTAARANPAVEKGNPVLLKAEALHGLLVCDFRDFDEGRRMLEEAAAMAKVHHTDDSEPLGTAMAFLGRCLVQNRRHLEAIGITMTAYETMARRAEPAVHVLADIAASIARMQCDAGRVAPCAEYTAKALEHAAAMPSGEIRARALGFLRPPQVMALLLQGKTNEAIALADEFLREPYCCEATLTSFRGQALRLEGRYAEAVQALDKAIAISTAKSPQVERFRLWPLVHRANAQLDLQQPVEALATIEQARPLLAKYPGFGTGLGLAHLVLGRALLVNGRAAEALEPLRESHDFWLGHDPGSVWAAEADYWFGRALAANGEARRGQHMVSQAQRTLATSPFKSHRELADRVVK